MNNLIRSPKFIVAAIAILALVLLPIITPDRYILYTVTGMLIWAVLSISLFLNIRMHVYNFCPAGLMLVGAYATGIMTTKLELSFWLTLPAAALAVIILALIIGFVSFRTKGLYFILITASLSQVLVLLVANLPQYTNGWSGIPMIKAPQFFNLIDFTNRSAYYWLSFVFLVVAFLFCYRLWHSHIGKIYRVVGDNPALAESVGVPLAMYRLQNFAVTAVLFALAGCFHAAWTGYIDPNTFGFDANNEPWFYMVMGGSGTLLGPLLGTGVVRYLRVLFNFMAQLQPIVVGVSIILIIIFLPMGIVSVPEKLKALITKLSGKPAKGAQRAG